MPDDDTAPAPAAAGAPAGGARPLDEESLGYLVTRLSDQTSHLVRSEVELAKAEMSQKGKQAGIGIGALGGAGLLALYGLGVLLAAAVLGLSEALPGWLAALIVGAVVLLVAGAAALVGKSSMSKATPAKPEQAIEGIGQDIATVKENL